MIKSKREIPMHTHTARVSMSAGWAVQYPYMMEKNNSEILNPPASVSLYFTKLYKHIKAQIADKREINQAGISTMRSLCFPRPPIVAGGHYAL